MGLFEIIGFSVLCGGAVMLWQVFTERAGTRSVRVNYSPEDRFPHQKFYGHYMAKGPLDWRRG